MRLTGALFAIAVVGVIGISAVFYNRVVPALAVQQPRVSLDMVASDDPTTASVEVANTYVPSVDNDFDGLPDPGSNVMSVGAIDSCFIHDEAGNNAAHLHGFGGTNTTDAKVQFVVQNVEDASGWQARVNFDGTKLSITAAGQINHTPFSDGTVPVNFLNLAVNSTGSHKPLFGAQDIQNPDSANATVLLGSSALGVDSVAVSSDTPSKVPHDETTRTYEANGGGVLAQIQYVVRAGQLGTTNVLDLDDDNPNTPGSKVDVFTPSGLMTFDLAPADLGNGFHGEGPSCAPVDVSDHAFTNNTSLPASGLHIRLNGPVTPRLVQNAPDCPAPAISGDHSAGRVDLTWSSACVDKGEAVIVEITSWPQAQVSCSNWSTLGFRLFGDCDAAP